LITRQRDYKRALVQLQDAATLLPPPPPPPPAVNAPEKELA
jgi:hypothetical protein